MIPGYLIEISDIVGTTLKHLAEDVRERLEKDKADESCLYNGDVDILCTIEERGSDNLPKDHVLKYIIISKYGEEISHVEKVIRELNGELRSKREVYARPIGWFKKKSA